MDIFDLQDPMEQNSSKLSDDFNPFDDMVAQIQQRQMQAEQMPLPAFIEELNPEQRQAVEQTEGPLLVLSGAGTGKTKVLTTRIAYIIHQRKAKPWEILAVTFTNKASKEMKSRLERMIGGDAFSVWLGTFHSIGIKILRKHSDRIGLDTNFIVLGSDDQERLLKQILTESGIDTKKYEPKTLLEIIQRWKDKGLQPHQVTANENSGWCNGMALPFYQRYQQRLKELNAVDFGDLLLLPLTLLQNHADVLEQYQNKFRYILVDEYQDTNVAQYLLLRLLAKKWRNICCVGDDDQSIYSWRGAEVENILSFQSIFPDSAVIRLERNYRSTGHILGAASGLIAHNSGRLGKTLRPADEQGNRGEKVLVKGFFNGKQEAEQIVDMIETEQRSGTKLSDMAILVRASFQTRLFEEVLIQHGVPYKIIGGFKFYEREEIKDAVAYLRLVHNPHDDLAFTRIINKPKRGIGAQALEALQTTAREKKVSLFDSIAWAPLRPAVRKTLDSFVLLMKRAQEKLQTESLEDVAQMIMEDSGYLQMWRLDKSQSAEGRVENVQELYAVLKGFDSIQAFIEHATLVTDTDDTPTDEQLIVMTLHASKGLEFKNVYLPGWEDELFPHKKTLEESGDVGLEEERRLAYVGITRAKQKVIAMTILAKNRVKIQNTPQVADIKTLIKLLQNLGATAEFKDSTLQIETLNINSTKATYDIVRTMRASILVLGPLLARFGHCEVSLPGGCAIGARPIDLHLSALEKMGAKIEIKDGYVIASANDGLKGANIVFDKITVTGTENIVMAASLANGITKIFNAAKEPEVVQLCEILNQNGVKIEGIGTSELVIYGTNRSLINIDEITVIPDRIEAGTYMCAVAIAGGKVVLENINPDHLVAITSKLSDMGVKFEFGSNFIKVISDGNLKPCNIITTEFPGFPTDMQAQFMALACVADGVSSIDERLFENRFMHASELSRMGADIKLNAHIATITGGKLNGADVMATDLRASSALIIAALRAQGITRIHRIYHLDRGYENLESKLTAIGADIKRLSE